MTGFLKNCIKLSRETHHQMHQLLPTAVAATTTATVTTTATATNHHHHQTSSNKQTQKSKGFFISWKNMGKNMSKLPKTYYFPSMSFPNMLTMWYCGDITNNIPPYRMLSCHDVQHMLSKSGKKSRGKKSRVGKGQLSNMRTLVHHVKRAATLAGHGILVRKCVKDASPRNVLDLYNIVKIYFAFPPRNQ